MTRSWTPKLLALAAAVAAAAVAQAEEAKKAGGKPPDPKAMEEAMAAAATPGEPHKKLEPLVGTFEAHVKTWMDPSKPAEESTGTSENRWVLGNRFVESHFEGTFMGKPFSGMGWTGYDNVAKKYVGTWIDSMGTGIMMSTGKAERSGALAMSGTVLDPMTGKPQTFREKTTVADADHHTMEMWGPGPDGKSYKMMEIHYQRKK